VAIIDYGAGNLFSINCAFKKQGMETKITSDPEELRDVDAIVLPGVGSFQAASQNLRSFRNKIEGSIKNGTPLLGVCLGMQLFFQASEEGPGEGLEIFDGKVLRLPDHVKTPHMGWNTLKISRDSCILDGIRDGDYFYFVHSYFSDPSEERITVAETDYGLTYPSVVAYKNIYGTQFHPEKSGTKGQRIIQNFSRIIKR